MKRYYIAAVVLVIVSITAALGSVKLASPVVSDTRAASDLEEINNSLVTYHDRYNKLPDTLLQIQVSPEISKRLSQYEYVPATSTPTYKAPRSSIGNYAEPVTSSYKLCATFQTDTLKKQSKPSMEDFNPSKHMKGRQCFTNTVNGTSYTPGTR